MNDSLSQASTNTATLVPAVDNALAVRIKVKFVYFRSFPNGTDESSFAFIHSMTSLMKERPEYDNDPEFWLRHVAAAFSWVDRSVEYQASMIMLNLYNEGFAPLNLPGYKALNNLLVYCAKICNPNLR